MAVCSQSVVCLGDAAPSPQRGPVGDRFAHSRGTDSLLAGLWFGFFQVDFSERTLALADLPPAWDGLKILHLSDLHLCGTPDREFYYAVMDRCHEWDPDLVALTGDIVDSDEHHRWIFPVLSRLRW